MPNTVIPEPKFNNETFKAIKKQLNNLATLVNSISDSLTECQKNYAAMMEKQKKRITLPCSCEDYEKLEFGERSSVESLKIDFLLAYDKLHKCIASTGPKIGECNRQCKAITAKYDDELVDNLNTYDKQVGRIIRKYWIAKSQVEQKEYEMESIPNR